MLFLCGIANVQALLNDTATSAALRPDSTIAERNSTPADSVLPAPADTDHVIINESNDSIPRIEGEIVEMSSPEEEFHSPHRASMFAAVIPGLGQMYNKKYWKVPLLFAGIGGVVYGLTFNSERYTYYRNAYRDFVVQDPSNKSYLEILVNSGISNPEAYLAGKEEWFLRYLDNSKKRFKRYRELSYAGIFALYLVSVIDASIDAHFYYFDISDDLSLQVTPAYMHLNSNMGGAMGLQMVFTF
jgi:hypothetical protein